MTDETKTTNKSETKKEISNVDDIVATLAKKLSEQSTSAFSKLSEDIAKQIATANADVLSRLKKLEDANPVEHGARMEQKPKESDEKDVGAETTASNDYGRSKQGSVVAPSVEAPSNDKSGLSMENKSLDSKLDSVYKEVKAVRPAYLLKAEETIHAPTAYQVLKAFESGWDGKYKNATQSYDEMMLRMMNGEFGTGFPRGYN